MPGSQFKPQEPGVNIVPFVIAFFCIVIFIVGAASNTWIGQLAKQGHRPEDPLEKMTFMEARSLIESELNKGLAAAGAKGKIQWVAPGGENKPADINVAGPIEMTIDTSLSAPELRKQIVDPIKPYMEKAQLGTLTMTDSRSHATWTYNMSPGLSPAEPDEAAGP